MNSKKSCIHEYMSWGYSEEEAEKLVESQEHLTIYDPNAFKRIESSLARLEVSIRQTGDTFKTTAEILEELSDRWIKMTPRKKGTIALLLSGDKGLNKFICYMNNLVGIWKVKFSELIMFITGKK